MLFSMRNKIGDGASWISTSILCLLSLPLVLLFNFYLNVSLLYVIFINDSSYFNINNYFIKDNKILINKKIYKIRK